MKEFLFSKPEEDLDHFIARYAFILRRILKGEKFSLHDHNIQALLERDVIVWGSNGAELKADMAETLLAIEAVEMLRQE